MRREYVILQDRNFNSTLVRLKVTHFLPSKHINIFQFHIGTIKSVEAEQMASVKTKFQFHIGTIKR